MCVDEVAGTGRNLIKNFLQVIFAANQPVDFQQHADFGFALLQLLIDWLMATRFHGALCWHDV